MIKTIIYRNMYQDSVKLMLLAQRVRELNGIEECSAVMATENNMDILKSAGLLTDEAKEADPDDIIVVIRGESNEAVTEGEIYVSDDFAGKHKAELSDNNGRKINIKSFISAKSLLPDANLALISVPGKYAAEIAHKAIDAGINAMLFSDNVSIEDEVRLKKRAIENGLIVMGPDCGTAVISGVSLGFGNTIKRGDIGIVGASGTGIQEVITLLDANDLGITHAIGTGGRDLQPAVGAISSVRAIEMLGEDENTKYIVFLSKPADESILTIINNALVKTGKPSVVILVGMKSEKAEKKDGIAYSDTIEGGIKILLEEQLGISYKTSKYTFQEKCVKGDICGLYSGGTLAFEALSILSKETDLELSSNVIFPGISRTSNIYDPEGNFMLDLGEDELTLGRAHPMINPSLRNEMIENLAYKKNASICMLDFIIGYGSHADPVGAVLPYIQRNRKIRAEKGFEQTVFLAHVCGTRMDPQQYYRQTAMLKNTNISFFSSNAGMVKYGISLRNQSV